MRLYILFFLFSSNILVAQSGFSKWYDLGTSAAYFHNVLLEEEYLYIAGAAWDEEIGKLAALFVKMDTLGNIIQYNTYSDTLDSHLVFKKGFPLLKTTAGNYMMAGDILNRVADFLITWNADGEVISFWEYPYAEGIHYSAPEELLEVSNGYLLFSSRQIDNLKIAVFITKIDFNGNIIWEESYGDYDTSQSFGSVWQEDENTFVIGASKTAEPSPEPNPHGCAKNWIFAVDSLGVMLWEWEGLGCEGARVKNLHPTSDGGWLYSTQELAYYSPSIWGFTPKFVKRDNDFNLLWEHRLADSYWDASHMVDMKPTPDGHWIGAAALVMPEPFHASSSSFNYLTSTLYKITETGDSTWARHDTITLSNQNLTYSPEPGGIVVLPSGSVITVGSFKEEIPAAPDKIWAWVYKVDKNGCLESPCIVTEVAEVEEKGLYFTVYPNPAHGQVTFERTVFNKKANLVLMDITGKVVWETKAKKGEKQFLWPTHTMPDGIYFYQWITDGAIENSGRLIIQK